MQIWQEIYSTLVFTVNATHKDLLLHFSEFLLQKHKCVDKMPIAQMWLSSPKFVFTFLLSFMNNWGLISWHCSCVLTPLAERQHNASKHESRGKYMKNILAFQNESRKETVVHATRIIMQNVIQLYHSQWCNFCDSDTYDFCVLQSEICDMSILEYNLNFRFQKVTLLRFYEKRIRLCLANFKIH